MTGSGGINHRAALMSERFCLAAGAGSALVGLSVMGGWLADVAALKSVLPGMATMKVNTAICFVLLGAAFLALRRGGGERGLRAGIGAGAAGVAAVIGLATILEYLIGIDFGIDQAIVAETAGAAQAVHLGRMSPATALGIVLLGLGLLTLGRRVGRWRPSEVLAGVGFAISLLAVIGYVYGAYGFYSLLPNFNGVALHTAVVLLALSAALALVGRDHWVRGLLAADDAGGILARRLVPTALILPLALEALSLTGQWAGLYGAEAAAALHATLVIVVLLAIVLATARLLRRLATEQRILAEELERARKGLEASVDELTTANEEVRNFAYIVSHDLRAPLVNIQGFCGELRLSIGDLRAELAEVAEALPPEVNGRIAVLLDRDLGEAMDFIDGATTKMDRLINAILKLSRLGRQTLRAEPVDLGAVVASAVETLRHDLERGGATVAVEALPTLLTDRMAMEQVVGNLLSNAVKYLAAGRPGRLRIWAENGPDGATLHFEDNGRGMAAEDIPRAFELFRRIGRHDTPGEGMGLAYVQTLLRRLRGRIWCDSAVGEGTTFHVFLPWFTAQAEKGSN